MFLALYVLFGTRELGLDVATLGLILGIGSAAALVGALASGWAVARLGLGTAIIVAAFLGSVEMLPAAFATPSLAVPLFVLSGLMGNFGWIVYIISQIGLRQAITPIALQGRMNGSMQFISVGMYPLGAIAGGALAQFVGCEKPSR